MIKKIFRQMALFYSQMCPAYNRDKFVHLEDGYGNGEAQAGPTGEHYHVYQPEPFESDEGHPQARTLVLTTRAPRFLSVVPARSETRFLGARARQF